MPSNRHRQPLFLATLLASLLVAGPAAAQEVSSTQEAPDGTFFERIAVDIVNVEVYVSDKSGEPVGGLERDDFVVTEDGKPVEIVNFHHVSAGRVASEPPSEPPSSQGVDREPLELPPGVETTIPESQRLHLIVYVDNFHIHPLNRNRVLLHLRSFLRTTVKPGDDVMIASYDRSLHIRHPFTSDPELVNNAMRELETLSGVAVERESERAAAVKAIYEAQTLRAAESHAREFSDSGYHELGLALKAVDELIDSLAGLPGRKMLLHVSDGLPMVPGQDLFAAIQNRFADISALGQAVSWDMSREFNRVIARANSNRISFYTIDAGGLRVQSGMGAENPAVSSPHVVSGTIDGVRRRNLQAPLLLMAAHTGGQSIVNTNNMSGGLERFARDFGNYYSLGYRAPTTSRGQYHKIEVRLRNKTRGQRIRHRDGYRDKSIEAKISDGVTAFLVHSYQPNPLGVSLDLGQQSLADDGLVNVAIRVRVPMEKLVFLPYGDVHVSRLSLYFGATDEKGRDAELEELSFELRIPESSLEKAKQDEVVRVVNATMRKGMQKVVVAVRDEIAEERSIVGRYVRIGSS